MSIRTAALQRGQQMTQWLAACALALAALPAAAAPLVQVIALNTTHSGYSTCPPTDFSCTGAQPIGPAGRSAFFSELKSKGLQIVAAPAPATVFRISSTLRNLEVRDRPDKDGHYAGSCEVTGLVLGGRIPPRLSELDLRHRFRLSPANFDAAQRLSPAGMENAIALCLRRQAHWIAEIIKKYP
jgi:hypothetical protein